MKWGIRLQVTICIGVFLLAALSGCGQPQVSIQQDTAYPITGPPYIPTDYLIGNGDQLEVLYHIDPGYTRSEYVIDTEDKLRVEFYYYPIMSRQVRVRPDGYVTLPRIGDVKAAGRKPMAFARILHQAYQPYLKRPNITVEVVGFDAKIEELKKSIMTYERGQSRLVVVRPDGKISLPLIQDVEASGMTAVELSCLIEKHYKKYVESLSISVAVLKARSNRVYVMGHVYKPNYYELLGPTTLSQVVSMAGGLRPGASSQQVVVVSRGDNGQPIGRLVDLEAVVGTGNIGADVLLRQYDVIYIPPTMLESGAIGGDALWRLIPLRFVMNGTYSFGGFAPR